MPASVKKMPVLALVALMEHARDCARSGASGPRSCPRSRRSPPSRCSSRRATGSGAAWTRSSRCARSWKRRPTLPPVALPRTDDWTAWRYRAVVATGTFDAARQILIDNKVRGGRAGFDVVTPLALSDGRFVLVNRGWVAGGATRADLPSAPPPAGCRRRAGARQRAAGRLRRARRSDARGRARLAEPRPRALRAGHRSRRWCRSSLEQTAAVVRDDAPARDDALARDWPAPDFGVDKHRIYMMQWYAFAATAAGLWLYYTLRRQR